MQIPSSQQVTAKILLIARSILITVDNIEFGRSIICINFISEIIENASVENKKVIQCRGDFDSDLFTKSLAETVRDWKSTSARIQSWVFRNLPVNPQGSPAPLLLHSLFFYTFMTHLFHCCYDAVKLQP